MRWVWVVIPLILFGIVGMQESFAEENRTYTLEEALEIQRNRTDSSITNDSLLIENILPRKLTAEEKDFESCKVGLNHHVNYDLGSWSVSIQRSDDNYCYVNIVWDLEGGGSDIFCSLPIEEYKVTDWNTRPWFPIPRNQDTFSDFCHNIKSSSAFFRDYEVHFSPNQQIKFGILPNDIICKQDLELIFKSSGSPACVKSSTADKLIQRGWAIVQNDNRGGSFSPTSYFDSHLTMSHPPKLNETAEITFQITYDDPRDVPDYHSVIRLPEGFELVSGNLEQTRFWKSGDIHELNATIKAVQSGNWTIDGVGEGGAISTLYIAVSEDEAYFHDGPFPSKPRPPYVIKGPIEDFVDYVDSIEIINGCKDVGGDWLDEHNECESAQITESFENFCNDFNGEYNSCASGCRNYPAGPDQVCTAQCFAVCEFD